MHMHMHTGTHRQAGRQANRQAAGKPAEGVRTTCSSSKIHEQYRDRTQHAIDLISGVGSARFYKGREWKGREGMIDE